jgi:3-isopropylmalate dehydrogenase
MAEVRKIIAHMNDKEAAGFATDEGLVGGSAYDAHGQAISDATWKRRLAADAVLFGAVGGPKWDAVPYDSAPGSRPAAPAQGHGALRQSAPGHLLSGAGKSSSLKKDVIEGLDILIVRELTGGVYFGEPKEIIDLGNGQKRGIDTQVYDTYEIERIAAVAFELARTRATKSARWKSATS